MRFDRPLRQTLCIVALALTGTACMQNQPPVSSPVAVPPSSRAPQADPVVQLLQYADTLANSEPEQREQAVADAQRAAARAPGARHYARLAMAYGMPAQRRYTPDEAARYAQLALEADDANWSPAARQYLHQYARLYTTLTRPAPTASKTTAAHKHHTHAGSDGNDNDNDKQRIAELQAQLAEAHRKLREMADIEDHLSTTE